MTKEKAIEIKSVLVEIKDVLPNYLVDRVFNYYKTELDPGANKPCTCQPRYWNEFLVKLRNEVEKTLAEESVTNE